MSKPNLTHEAVLEALAEFDELGRNAFLRKYGFDRSTAYFLFHEGAYYDSKAIVGVAHGLTKPREGALRAKDFSGGEATVKRWLKEVGFEVVKLPGGRIFGEIPGCPAGTTFVNRTALAESGVHRPLEAGICGSEKDGGAESIVVSGGYEDDQDQGDLILYTGHGGQKRGTRTQTADQELTRQNLALAHNIDTGLPVRVVRGGGASAYAPKAARRS